MAKLVNLIISFMVVTLVWPGMIAAQEEKKKPVNERILEILIEKNIITKEQYEDLLKQAKEEESAEKERLAREKELQKKKEEGKKPMEEMHSDNWIDFIERSIANKIAPSRDVGMMFHGNISDDLFYYELGLFNGYKANTLNVDDGKDLAGRVVVAPFLKSGLKALEGLRLGGSFTYGNEDLTASQWWNSGQWKTAAGTTYMAINNSVVQSGRRTRGGLELYWDWGSTKLQAEYMRVNLEGLKYGNLKNDYSVSGGYFTISHILTGEKFVFMEGKPGRIRPLRPFRLGGPGWGAWQIGVRLEFVKGDKGLLDQGFVDSTRYTNKATGFTLGINWYPVSMVRFMLNYYHMKFADDITVEDSRIDHEDVILTRCELVL